MREGPIRIAVDARPFAGSPCGYTIYLASILQCIRNGNFEITLLSNKPLLDQYDETKGLENYIFGANSELHWEQKDLPEFLSSGGHDLYFSGANRGIPLKKNTSRTRYILGLLDVIPYIFFQDYYVRRWKDLIRAPRVLSETLAQLIAVMRADAILTISQQSGRDIRRLFRRTDVTACLIRLKDVEQLPPRPPLLQFVYVGGVDARKKVAVLLHAFARFVQDHPDHSLVLVGSNYAALEPLIAELGLSDRVVITGYVDHDTKFRILNESRAMVYPSIYEGYGMAIAEGFQAGIPVIAGRGGAQEEVGGEGIRTIDPCSADDIRAAMEEMLSPALRADWIARGHHQLRRLADPNIEVSIIEYFTEQGRLARLAPA